MTAAKKVKRKVNFSTVVFNVCSRPLLFEEFLRVFFQSLGIDAADVFIIFSHDVVSLKLEFVGPV